MDRTLALPKWCLRLLASRQEAAGPSSSAPVLPSATGGSRDRDNASRYLRAARTGTEFEWVVSHTARRTVATLPHQDGLSSRSIADVLGHARVSMTQDVYMGRRVAGLDAARALDDLDGSETAG